MGKNIIKILLHIKIFCKNDSIAVACVITRSKPFTDKHIFCFVVIFFTSSKKHCCCYCYC